MIAARNSSIDMANPEQLGILKQEVKIWNQWREKNPNIQINLSDAEFGGTDLSNADLSNADLSNSNLSSADLSNANLSSANLSSADLSNANLSDANLSSANFIAANLSDCILSDANLSNANLSDANLSNAQMMGNDLSSANLINANLSSANLNDANLSNANLSSANLNDANLSNANLSSADLCKIQALGTNFYEATLTGACIESWNINSQSNLDNVICDFIYLKRERNKFLNRRPLDSTKNFQAGDFANYFTIEEKDLFLSTEGRIRRSTYGIRFIILFFSQVIMNLISPFFPKPIAILLTITIVILLIIQTIKRLHDINQTGWYSLFIFIPIANLFFILWLIFQDGTVGQNKYGKDTKKRNGKYIIQEINGTNTKRRKPEERKNYYTIE